MITKEILCFDFRAPLGAIATTDPNIWKCSECAIEELDKKFGGRSRLLDWYVAVGFYKDMPIEWILEQEAQQYKINAYVVDAADLKNVIEMYGDFIQPNNKNNRLAKEYILNNWSSLGFDICTPDLAVSAIHSIKDLDICLEMNPNEFNSCGLLQNRDCCIRIISENNFLFHDGQGFMPVEIYTNQIKI